MKKTIVFLHGIFIPNWLGGSKFVWDKSQWEDYNCIWLESKVPYSDMMVERELDRLQRLMEKHPGAVIAGHSLGAWWAANLACRHNCDLAGTVLWTPLINHELYPIFNATARYHPCKQAPNPKNTGAHKMLVFYGENDLIVPHKEHSYHSINHFKATPYALQGGHFWQTNHTVALQYMKDWIEVMC